VKQPLQNLKSGKIELVEEPQQGLKGGCLLVTTRATLISAGTERMLVEFGKAGYLTKAISPPDKVKQVLDKIRTDGIATTIKSVQAKLDQPLPLGYSNVGIVQRSEAGGQKNTDGRPLTLGRRTKKIVTRGTLHVTRKNQKNKRNQIN
jgi:hypothetical protein